MQIMSFFCCKTVCEVKTKLANLAFKGPHSLASIYLSGLFAHYGDTEFQSQQPTSPRHPPPPAHLACFHQSLILSITLVKMEPDDFAFLVQLGRCLQINESCWYLRTSEKYNIRVTLNILVGRGWLYLGIYNAQNSPFPLIIASFQYSACSVRMRCEANIEIIITIHN